MSASLLPIACVLLLSLVIRNEHHLTSARFRDKSCFTGPADMTQGLGLR